MKLQTLNHQFESDNSWMNKTTNFPYHSNEALVVYLSPTAFYACICKVYLILVDLRLKLINMCKNIKLFISL